MKSLDERLSKVIEGVRRYGADKALIFGSSARGDADQYSDIDLIVVKQTDRRFIDRLLDVVECIRPDFALDVLVYTPEEFERMRDEGNPLVTRAVEEGKVIYERPTG
jgi:predicted nucleotidyltransferase